MFNHLKTSFTFTLHLYGVNLGNYRCFLGFKSVGLSSEKNVFPNAEVEEFPTKTVLSNSKSTAGTAAPRHALVAVTGTTVPP